jgi:hypothetical protein
MRGMLAAVALGTAVAVLAGPASLASGSAAKATCARGHARVVAADAQGEVYIAQEPYYEVGTHVQLGTLPSYRGCVYGSRRSFRLGITESGGSRGGVGTRVITLAGTYVAYTTERVVVESGFELLVVVRNLRTGHILKHVPTGIPLERRPTYIGVGAVRAMVLKSDGAVAWIASDHLRSEKIEHETGREVEYYDLYALDKTGERLLASGPELGDSSLALAGSTLYWTLGGKPYSALLH